MIARPAEASTGRAGPCRRCYSSTSTSSSISASMPGVDLSSSARRVPSSSTALSGLSSRRMGISSKASGLPASTLGVGVDDHRDLGLHALDLDHFDLAHDHHAVLVHELPADDQAHGHHPEPATAHHAQGHATAHAAADAAAHAATATAASRGRGGIGQLRQQGQRHGAGHQAGQELPAIHGFLLGCRGPGRAGAGGSVGPHVDASGRPFEGGNGRRCK
jgi:hypothetical protein